MRSLSVFLLTISMLFVMPVHAAPMQSFVFDDPEKDEIFKRLGHEIRCLVCQNQSISDSNAGLATDLREEIYRMLQDGKSETEITDFLVERYGDFVLYDPPMKPITWMLWFGPMIMFVIGVYFALSFIRSHRLKDTGSTTIDNNDMDRLKELQQEARRELEKDGDA